MSIGEKIMELLVKEKMTQKELATKINVTESSMSRYINNERVPRIDVLANLSNVLNVSIEYFTQEKNDNGDFLEVKRLVARNASRMTQEQKLELARILLKD
ncbi:MAG TPA: helix-turn-helix transcriptional regulator [Gallicola sp.]|jgi:transcriptional regulator with XRE-family HTH domain|nr:helix-turn-helix transcriptional regulator [Gallicola sp.]